MSTKRETRVNPAFRGDFRFTSAEPLSHAPRPMNPESKTRPQSRFRFQEAGLLLVVVVLGALLAFFGGSVRQPKLEAGPDGNLQRVFTTNADGERVAVFEE